MEKLKIKSTLAIQKKSLEISMNDVYEDEEISKDNQMIFFTIENDESNNFDDIPINVKKIPEIILFLQNILNKIKI